MKDKVKLIKELAKSINTYEVDSVEYENEDFQHLGSVVNNHG